MTRCPAAVAAAFGALLAMGAARLAEAQTPPPRTYSFTAKSELVWPQSTHTVNRDGARELVEIRNQAGDFHTLILYDFQAHRIYTRDLVAGTCNTQEYTSPNAPGAMDPIGDAAAMGAVPKPIRTETVNGIAARVVEAALPSNGKFTYWLDAAHGFPVRQTMTLPGKPERVLLEMQQLSYTPPPASLFTPPAECTRMGGSSSATGGHVETKVETGAPSGRVPGRKK